MDKLEKSRQVLSTAILNNFVGRITGAGLFRIVGSNPENILLVGKLMSTKDEEGQGVNFSKTFIESIGVDFYISESAIDDAVVELLPQGDFYYRALPTLEEQRQAILKEINESGLEREYASFDEIIDSYNSNESLFDGILVKLVPVYKKISIDSERAKIVFNPGELLNDSRECGFADKTHHLNKGLEAYLQDMQSNLNSEEDIMTKVITEPTKVENLLS